jgi:hypothetical protein
MASEIVAPEPGFWERLRHWLFGDPARPGRPRVPGVLNQDAPASCAGDSPWLTSHGEGPSHAHEVRADESER